MAVWTVVMSVANSRDGGRVWSVTIADHLVCAALTLASLPVQGAAEVGRGAPTLTTAWAAAPVLASALLGGPWGGVLGALVQGAASVLVRGELPLATLGNVVLLLLAGGVGGYVARLAVAAERRLAEAVRLTAATRERERLARSIHDGVLQVLALVRRRGAELGGPAADLARLAGEQEVALRTLITTPPPATPPATGGSDRRGSRARDADGPGEGGAQVDLRGLLGAYRSETVTVSGPAGAVLLAGTVAGELAAAVGAALDNVARHAGGRAWVLVEDLGDAVVVSVRDDGPGIPAGRVEEAAAQGRLGVGGVDAGPGGRAGRHHVRIHRSRRGDRGRVPGAPGGRTRMVRLMVVDDHPIWRDGVARDLAEAGHEVVATAADGPAAVRRAAAARPEVVLMDLQLPVGSGVDATRDILAADPSARVLVLSASGEDADVLAAVKAGATGYLVKSAGRDELLAAVDKTARGEAVFSPGLAGLVLGEFRRMAAGPRDDGSPKLTERELEVLRLVAKGLSARQVADRLVLSHRTVQNHVQNTLRKLQLHNRVELTRYAIERGLDTDPA